LIRSWMVTYPSPSMVPISPVRNHLVPSSSTWKVDHPDVEDAAVTGMWVDDMATELPVGFVVLSLQASAVYAESSHSAT
jgi:hypothetical protein